MFDLENMLQLNPRNIGITLIKYFFRKNAFESLLLIRSFFRKYDPYVNEQMSFHCIKDPQLRLVHNDI